MTDAVAQQGREGSKAPPTFTLSSFRQSFILQRTASSLGKRQMIAKNLGITIQTCQYPKKTTLRNEEVFLRTLAQVVTLLIWNQLLNRIIIISLDWSSEVY